MTDAHPSRVLSSSVLVLNRCYLAVHVISVRRAFVLLYRDCAEVVDLAEGQYVHHDFASWCEMSMYRAAEKLANDDWVRAVQFEIQVPRIIRLLRYDRVPRTALRFNRRNLFARDGHRCQYCGGAFPASQLSIDHVVPRSRGGETCWDNVVSACLTCNTRKGGRTPQEAHMHLISHPVEPTVNPLLAMKLNNPKYESWKTFVPTASATVHMC